MHKEIEAATGHTPLIDLQHFILELYPVHHNNLVGQLQIDEVVIHHNKAMPHTSVILKKLYCTVHFHLFYPMQDFFAGKNKLVNILGIFLVQ